MSGSSIFGVSWLCPAVALMLGPYDSASAAEPAGLAAEGTDVKAEAVAFLREYYKELSKLEREMNLAWWRAANTGTKEAYEASAQARLALRRFHSDPERYRKIQQLLQARNKLPRIVARALRLAELEHKPNQLPAELLKEMVERSTEI